MATSAISRAWACSVSRMPSSRTFWPRSTARSRPPSPTVRAGARGGDVIAAGEAARTAGPSAAFTDFVAHGMGLISHEVPFLLTGAMYEGVDAERPLEAGMVLSIETTMFHPRRGFIKLEDTVVVTAEGCEMFGDRGREWNRGGRQHPV